MSEDLEPQGTYQVVRNSVVIGTVTFFRMKEPRIANFNWTTPEAQPVAQIGDLVLPI
jgi:hypothetical protein